MLTLLTNVNVYSPEPRGINCVLVAAGKIIYLGAAKPQLDEALETQEIDLGGASLVPGFIDAHVHLTGGGGEDGFSTQAPCVPLSQFTRFGVTSVVGLLGTDDETRSTENLVARTYALREEGLSAWCWTGGYHVPPRTLTGSVRKDIVSIECIIGLGELAISDHRSSQPTFDELARIAADVHVAGLISRKAGVLHFHLGDGDRGLKAVRDLIDTTELPARMFHPTHVNRRKALFSESIELASRGVTIDVTAFPVADDEDAWSAADAWELYQQQGGPERNFTISSDGGGCLPVFDDDGRMAHMSFATSEGITDAVAELARRGHTLDKILPAVTTNVADLLRLTSKGRIAPGHDADLVILNEQFRPQHVMANGQWMIRDEQPIVKGTFEG